MNIGLAIDLLRLDDPPPPPLGYLSDNGKNPPLLRKNGDFIPLQYLNENTLGFASDPNGESLLLQNPPPLLYLHGDVVAGSNTNLSDPKLRSKLNEYDLLSRKSLRSNWSSGSCVISPVSAGTGCPGASGNSGRGSRTPVSRIMSSRLGRILAAITGIKGDTAIPDRQRGQLAWERSHISIQSTWNAWWHDGRIRIRSLSSNSRRQTAQSCGATTPPLPLFFV